MVRHFIFGIFLFNIYNLINGQCVPSVTTVSGTAAPSSAICSGDLIFEDNFDSVDLSKWQKENTLGGGWVNIYVKLTKIKIY